MAERLAEEQPELEEPEEFSDEPRSVREFYGSAKNIREHGSPSDSAETESIRYFFYPTWRSQLMNLLGFFVLCGLCILLSKAVPALVIPGKLFTINGVTLFLYFPLLSLIPLYLLGKILIRVYDAKYIIDEGGVEAQIGLVSFNLRQPRLRWEDIRGSEPQQTLGERVLNIGTVMVGSAMTQDVEIVMTGVASPRAIQLLIQGERERRLQDLRGSGGGPSSIRTDAVLKD